jgi:hypothetical protein
MTRLTQFALYETKTRFYIIANDTNHSIYRIAKVDKTSTESLSFTDDQVVYSGAEVKELLGMIAQGNKSTGGLKKIIDFCGIFGFVTFLDCYYMILITKKSPVALIGGHYIYHVDDTLMIPITTKTDRKVTPNEQRYMQVFQQIDMTKNFYFSYTYDVTNSLQSILTKGHLKPNDMFVWNRFLTQDVFDYNSEWYIPIIYGFVDQSKISVYGHCILVTLIARRSNRFAGARFLKRGTSEQGYVANDVETEQIVNDESTTSFSLPYAPDRPKPAYTSFLQHRGSIPLYWSQENSSMAAKPLIQLDVRDPYYSACAKHFNQLFRRYGTPIIVLNLVKSKEKIPRESILLDEFTNAIKYLNQSLPQEHKVKYVAWDMARASKTDQDVIGHLERLAEEFINDTSFFHTGNEPFANAIHRANSQGKIAIEYKEAIRLQKGIVRTNCIDCLDRTNAAQFVIGKCALGLQLYALGVISQPTVPFDSDATNVFNAMYHDHGDTIALQYGGSHLVNTMETYRKISAWTSHSRDIIESIRRYYSNSFTDAEKQDSINLFLGYFVPKKSTTFLWDLPTDFELHNAHPMQREPISSYVQWWDPAALNTGMEEHPLDKGLVQSIVKRDLTQFDEYYTTNKLTSIDQLYAFKMISTNSSISSFVPRINPTQPPRSLVIYNLNIGGVKRWLRPRSLSPVKRTTDQSATSTIREEVANTSNHTTAAIVERLLNPTVKPSEQKEYSRYLRQFKHNTVQLTPQPSADSFEDVELAKDHPDFDFFQNYIQQSGILVDTKDESVYKHCVASGETDSYLGIGAKSGDKSRMDGYNNWFETGIYTQTTNRSKKKL